MGKVVQVENTWSKLNLYFLGANWVFAQHVVPCVRHGALRGIGLGWGVPPPVGGGGEVGGPPPGNFEI